MNRNGRSPAWLDGVRGRLRSARRWGGVGSLVRALGSCAATALLLPCRAQENAANTTSTFPRSETLYVGGLQWGEPTSFNPLLSTPAWPVPNGDQTCNL